MCKKKYIILCFFFLDISTLDDCDRTINKPEVLKSPSHPFYYGHVTKCTWSVDFPNDTFIRVEIVELDIAAPDTQVSLENVRHFKLFICVIVKFC